MANNNVSAIHGVDLKQVSALAKDSKPVANEDVVKSLEVLLEQAKRGDIQSFVALGVGREVVHYHTAGTWREDSFALVGLIEKAKQRLLSVSGFF